MKAVTVMSGPHQGRSGNIVSIPWIGNLWHLRVQVNVPMTEEEIKQHYSAPVWSEQHVQEKLEDLARGFGPRTWLDLWCWQVTPSSQPS